MIKRKLNKILTATLVTAIVVAINIPVGAEEISWRGKLESDLVLGDSTVSDSFSLVTNSLRLEMLLPWSEEMEVKVSGNVYDAAGETRPLADLTGGGAAGGQGITFDRLYIRLYQPNYDLTLGRQPLNWGAGMFFNPADPFAAPADVLTGGVGTAPGYSGVNINVDTGTLSRFSAFHMVDVPVSGVKYRTNVEGTDLIGALVKDDLQTRLLLQAQGDLGVGWFAQTALSLDSDAKTLWAVGADYSWDGEIILKGEIANAQFYDGIDAGVSLQYIPDEFSSYILSAMVSPENDTLMLMPVYSTQLTDVLDLRVYGGYLRNGENKGAIGGAGLSYSF